MAEANKFSYEIERRSFVFVILFIASFFSLLVMSPVSAKSLTYVNNYTFGVNDFHLQLNGSYDELKTLSSDPWGDATNTPDSEGYGTGVFNWAGDFINPGGSIVITVPDYIDSDAVASWYWTVDGDAVPEPDVWFLLIVGFGFTGLVLRQQRTVVFTA